MGSVRDLRFHLEPVSNLIREGCFGEDAIERVNEFVAMLSMHAEQTAKDARARKGRLFEKRNCFRSQLKIDSLFEKQV